MGKSIFSCIGFDPKTQQRAKIRKDLARLTETSPWITEAAMVVRKRNGGGQEYSVRIVAKSRWGDSFASRATSENLESGVGIAKNRVLRQFFKKRKKSVKAKRHPTPIAKN